MRIPIKLSSDRLPSPLRSFLPCIHNLRRLALGDFAAEEFPLYVSSVLVDGTWKATAAGRHTLSDELVQELAATGEPPVVIDVGASDGSTSIDLIGKLGPRFRRFFVTDKLSGLDVRHEGSVSWFYDPRTMACVLRATDRLLVYNELTGCLPPLALLARALLRHAPVYDPDRVERLPLSRPELLELAEHDPRIEICDYDIFEPWARESADIVKVANVLNRAYFSPEQVALAVANLRAAVREGGYLLVIDNRRDAASYHHNPKVVSPVPVEKYSLFRKVGGRLKLEKDVKGGAETRLLVEDA